MAKPVPLSPDLHKGLKVDTRPSAAPADHVNRTLLFSTEFEDAHKDFPIFLHKDAGTGQFQAHCILGFDRDENLLLDDEGWRSDYVPAILERGPFMMGTRDTEADKLTGMEPVILFDADDARIGTDEGEAVFLPSGENSPYLDRVLRALRNIQEGLVLDRTFYSKLESLGLIEPLAVKVSLSNVEQINFDGYHAINEEKLASLDGDSLEALNKLGILPLLFFLISSMGNMSRLIDLKNEKTALA